MKKIGEGAEGTVYKILSCLVKKVWFSSQANWWTDNTLTRIRQVEEFIKHLPKGLRLKCAVPEFVGYEYTKRGKQRLITYHEYIPCKQHLSNKDRDLLAELDKYFVDVRDGNVIITEQGKAYLVDVYPRKYLPWLDK